MIEILNVDRMGKPGERKGKKECVRESENDVYRLPKFNL